MKYRRRFYKCSSGYYRTFCDEFELYDDQLRQMLDNFDGWDL